MGYVDDIKVVLTTWGVDRPSLQKVRREVFIVEQHIPESEEWDDEDLVSHHALATLNREPVGTGRLTPAGKIGRLAVKAGMRGQGVGAALLKRLIREGYRLGRETLYLHAQLHAVPFYEKLGFRTEGEIFDEAGIPHVLMRHAGEQKVLSQPQNVIATRSIISTLDEARLAAQQVAAAASRLLTMYTPDLETQVYDQPVFLETVKRLVLARSYAKVRVLLSDPARMMYENSKFVHLARRITSHIEIRHVKREYRSNQSAYLVADDRAIVYRLQAARWDGICELNDAAVARRYLNHFDEVWIASEPEPELRQQHL